MLLAHYEYDSHYHLNKILHHSRVTLKCATRGNEIHVSQPKIATHYGVRGKFFESVCTLTNRQTDKKREERKFIFL